MFNRLRSSNARNYPFRAETGTFHFSSKHHPRMLCAKFGWNWPSGSWEEDENGKSLQTGGQTDRRTTDDRRSEKLTWAFSSGELKTFYFLKLGDFHVDSIMSCTHNVNGIRKFRKGSRARTSIIVPCTWTKQLLNLLSYLLSRNFPRLHNFLNFSASKMELIYSNIYSLWNTLFYDHSILW